MALDCGNRKDNLMRCVIFDLDGTLADTSRDLISAANACLEGAALDPVADAATAFRGGRAMLRLGFERAGRDWTEAEVDAAYPRLLAHYAEHIDRHTVLYPGVGAALARLEAAGWALGVCTNKPAHLAQELLERLGIRAAFRAMLGADSLPVRKPDPRHLLETITRAGGNPARSVLVGDTVTDRKAAENAGVPCILVTFGPDGEAVRNLQPEALLEHYDALPALLDRLVV